MLHNNTHNVIIFLYIKYKQLPPRIAAVRLINGFTYATTSIMDFESGLPRMATFDVYKCLNEGSLRFCKTGKNGNSFLILF